MSVSLHCPLMMAPSLKHHQRPAAVAAAASQHQQDPTPLTIDERIDKLFALYDKHGQMNYVGENVSQLQHAQQVRMSNCIFINESI